MPKKKKKVENWRTSKGRELLLADVRSGTIHADMDDEEAFQSRPEFAVGESLEEAKRLFEGRLKSARGIIGRKNTRASSELALLREDRKVHPPPPTNHRRAALGRIGCPETFEAGCRREEARRNEAIRVPPDASGVPSLSPQSYQRTRRTGSPSPKIPFPIPRPLRILTIAQ